MPKTYNTYKSFRNLFILLWLVAIVAFFLLVYISSSSGQDYALVLLGVVLFGVYMFLGAIIAHKVANNTSQNRGRDLAKYMTITALFLFIPVVALYAQNLTQYPTLPEQTQAELIDCYIDGRAIKATRLDCAELSKREPVEPKETIVYIEPQNQSAISQSQPPVEEVKEEKYPKYTELILFDRRFNCISDKADDVETMYKKSISAKESLDDCSDGAKEVYAGCTEDCASKRYSYCNTKRDLWYSLSEDYTKLRDNYCYLRN